MTKKRGRPTKERFLLSMATLDQVTPAESTALKKRFSSLLCVIPLSVEGLFQAGDIDDRHHD
jgi:hypothetical protein